jgi:hypothetical protein
LGLSDLDAENVRGGVGTIVVCGTDLMQADLCNLGGIEEVLSAGIHVQDQVAARAALFPAGEGPHSDELVALRVAFGDPTFPYLNSIEVVKANA